MKVYAIRHTAVAVQPGICYGQSDVDVASSFQTEKGEVVKSVSDIEFERIYSSPLQRCRKLAEEVFHGKQIYFDDRLLELNFGEWELKSWDEIYSNPEGKKWMDDYQNLPTLNGESYPEMKQRVEHFLNDLKDTECEQVAVVAHAGVIRLLKHLIDGDAMDSLFAEFKPAYGSVTIFEL